MADTKEWRTSRTGRIYHIHRDIEGGLCGRAGNPDPSFPPRALSAARRSPGRRLCKVCLTRSEEERVPISDSVTPKGEEKQYKVVFTVMKIIIGGRDIELRTIEALVAASSPEHAEQLGRQVHGFKVGSWNYLAPNPTITEEQK